MRLHLFLVVLSALIGVLVAPIVPMQSETRVYPLPHHIPKYEGGVSLRFAMVHDVIHERFPWHGRAYFEERNRRARIAIADEDARRQPDEAPTAAYFALKDDLGVGLERQGKYAEAVALLRAKLQQQEAAGLKGRDLYSTKANLGTFLIHWQMKDGFADLPAAKQRLNEGLTLLRESMTANPQAHFGREIWQAVLLEFFLATLDDPTLWTRYDMIGDSLDDLVDLSAASCLTSRRGWGSTGYNRMAAKFLKLPGLGDPFSDMPDLKREEIRRNIKRVGAEEDWEWEVESSVPEEVAFDEPTLGIIGMWHYGGGANPHFALALGEIMQRVGQRYIAWCAYERAAKMGGRFNSDPEIARSLVAHCRSRQALIEKQLPAEERDALRPRFEKELAFGQRYQKAYQEYEAQRIQAGASIDDEQFYEAFNAEHPSIASPVGPEDQYLTEKKEWLSFTPIAVFLAGLFAFGTACLLRLPSWIRQRTRRSSLPPGVPPLDAAIS